jgi:signal transduction histidine kinase
MSVERLRILTHELRSPVAALTALAEQATLRDVSADVLRHITALAAQAGADIERLLADPELVSLRCELVELREALAVLVRPGVVIVGDNVAASCDPTRLRQAVGNLVANALRHGTSVVVDVRQRDGSAEIVVTDDGPGVAAGLDPFAAGVSGSGSTGYGLWLARAIVEAHGGRLELDPGEGSPGASFRLCLPLSGGVPG